MNSVIINKIKTAIKNKSLLFLSEPVSYLAISLLCIALINIWWVDKIFIGTDYYQYWVAGQAVGMEDVKSIYGEADRKMLREKFLSKAETLAAGRPTPQLISAKGHGDLELFSTPLMYSLFAAITVGDYEKDYRNFKIICVFVILISLITLCHLFELSLAETMIMICLLTWLSGSYIADIRVGNVNQILIGLLTLFLWLKHRSQFVLRNIFGGFVLGFAVIFKPTISIAAVLLVAVWLIDKQYKTILRQSFGFCLSACASLLITGYYFRSLQCWTEWLGIIKTMDSWNIPIYMGNQSLSRLILEWNGKDVSMILLIGLLIITIVVAWFGRSRSSAKTDADFHRESLAVGMGCVIMLLASNLAWLHYYILAAPLLLYLFRQGKGGKLHSPVTIFRKIVVMAVIVLYSVGPKFYLIGDESDQVHGAVIVSTATAMLLAAAWVDLYRGDKAS
jgi:hypothetical protein